MDNNNPLSPHIQIYRWHISSLVSISHRITGIVNIIAITVICLWIFSLLLGESSYDLTKLFLHTLKTGGIEDITQVGKCSPNVGPVTKQCYQDGQCDTRGRCE